MHGLWPRVQGNVEYGFPAILVVGFFSHSQASHNQYMVRGCAWREISLASGDLKTNVKLREANDIAFGYEEMKFA